MGETIKKLNAFIVILILIPVYFIVFGVGFVIYKMSMKKKKTTKSYWEKPLITSDFTSPY